MASVRLAVKPAATLPVTVASSSPLDGIDRRRSIVDEANMLGDDERPIDAARHSRREYRLKVQRSVRVNDISR